MASPHYLIHNLEEHLLSEANPQGLSQHLSEHAVAYDGVLQTIGSVIAHKRATILHDLFPISSLPTEILIEVFLLAIERRFWYLHSATKATLTLSHVCAHWRAIALQCKTLWDAVGFDSMGIDLALLFAARSGDLPMRLEFIRSKVDKARDADASGPEVSNSSNGSEADQIRVILDESCEELKLALAGADRSVMTSSLISLAPRITDLKIGTSIPHGSQALLAALCMSDEKRHLELKSLVVSNTHERLGFQRGCWHPELSDVLWPEELFVSGYIAKCECYPLSCVNTSRIKSLRIGYSSLECLPSLGLYEGGHWEALESLEFSNVGYISILTQPNPPHDFPQPREMTNLKKISFGECDPEILQYMGRNFLINNLTHLDYRESDWSRELHLFTFNNVLQLLVSRCDKLEYLSLGLFAHQYRAFGMMMTTRSCGAQCPNLKQLIFGVIDGYERCVSLNTVTPTFPNPQDPESGPSSPLGSAPLSWPSEFNCLCENIYRCDPDAHKGPRLAQILSRRRGMGLPKLGSLRVWLTTQEGHALATQEEAEYEKVAAKVEVTNQDFTPGGDDVNVDYSPGESDS